MTEAPAQGTQSKLSGTTRALAGSVVVWLLIMLAATDAVMRTTKQPDRTGDSYVSKFTTFLTSRRQSDVIFLGSSIAFAASYYADTTIDNHLEKGKTDRSYSKAEFIARQLSTITSSPVSIENLSSAGCMASDAALVLAKSLEFGKKPRLVIYELIERDLMDPAMLAPGETPYSRILSQMHNYDGMSWQQKLTSNCVSNCEGLANQQVFQELHRALSPALDSEDSKAQLKKIEAVISSLWCYYKNRASILARLQNQMQSLLHRQLTLAGAAEKMHAAAPATATAEKSISAACDLGPQENIDGIDWTPHRQRFAVERPYFLRLLKQCQDNKIALVVVNMPVRKIYRQRLDPTLKKRYLETLREGCAQYGAWFVDLSAMPDLGDSDFLDQNHANCQGAPKIQTAATRAIAAVPELRARLKQAL